MKHEPIVTDFEIRPATYPQGHWMNRWWGHVVRVLTSVVCRVPIYRYIPRLHPAAREVIRSGEPAIFTCIHQDIGDTFNSLPRLFKDRRFTAMVSLSRDGGLASMLLGTLGYEIVRGSSSRGGGEALVMVRACLASGLSVVMACDGPKAPLGDVKAGVLRLAASSGRPIIPVRSWGLVRYRFRHSWTKSSVTLPGLPAVVCLGEPLRIPAEAESTRPYQLELARRLHELAQWSSRWAGGPAVAPFKIAAK